MSQKSGEARMSSESKVVSVGGHEFTLVEPDFFDCDRAVVIYMKMVGEPAQILDSIRTGVGLGEDDSPETRTAFIGLNLAAAGGKFRHVTKDEALELLALTTDKGIEWFGEHRLSGPEFNELVSAIGSVLPFGRVLTEWGLQAVAFVNSFNDDSESAAKSSESDADGDQTTSPAAESDGPSHAPVALRKDTPAEN